jgi:hypothetical protein
LIQANQIFGEKNRCFSRSSDFPLIGFKLGDDLLEIAPQLPYDYAHEVWWQLVLIWPQNRRIEGGGDWKSLSALCVIRGYSGPDPWTIRQLGFGRSINYVF